jgi:lipopolysaccharide/colanic/teichoic acid biosynthesis glycosyltransferase
VTHAWSVHDQRSASLTVVGEIEPTPVVLTAAPARPIVYYISKRAIDITVALVTLILALPIMLVLAVLIRLDSPGPVLFRQRRLGEHARPFLFFKFRTMWVDARDRFPELYTYQYSDVEIRSMYFKVLDDPRLTRLGARLRKTSLDELPNLINVLLGEMTLVGPRPELPEMLPYYTGPQLMKFSVKPGVTGLAQVSGRAVLRFQQTITSDLEYCTRRSLSFDLWLLCRTITTIVQRAGAF